jgi:hypothetical protein
VDLFHKDRVIRSGAPPLGPLSLAEVLKFAKHSPLD